MAPNGTVAWSGVELRNMGNVFLRVNYSGKTLVRKASRTAQGYRTHLYDAHNSVFMGDF